MTDRRAALQVAEDDWPLGHSNCDQSYFSTLKNRSFALGGRFPAEFFYFSPAINELSPEFFHFPAAKSHLPAAKNGLPAEKIDFPAAKNHLPALVIHLSAGKNRLSGRAAHGSPRAAGCPHIPI
jgi:hypothetical protein